MRTMVLLALALMPTAARAQAVIYDVEIDQKSVVSAILEHSGKQTRRVSLNFVIRRLADRSIEIGETREAIRVEEDGVLVKEIDVFQPKSQPLTVVLAMDVSGSMAHRNKMEEAKRAALTFLDKLDARSDVGLILFDHEMKLAIPPARDPARQKEHRERLRDQIRNARPQGGTAYLDATVESVKLLKGIGGRKAVIIMTDGMDTNSKHTLNEAIDAGKAGELSVYTVGIGDKGRNDPVTTVLVLDRSGSMLEPADDGDKARGKKKIDALKEAANGFVKLMRKGARTTLLPFSDKIDKPEQFSDDKGQLEDRIARLEPFGGTLLYDATLDGVETLMVADPPGRRAVIVLTDGKDESPGSRHSDDTVVARAVEADIPLYMLGLGRKEDINEDVMRKMASKTKGKYYRAGNAKDLLDLFEVLSIELHDDGIDEASLRELAEKTGGKYYHAEKIDELSFIYGDLADALQSTYRVTYTSRRASHDGTARGIDVMVMRNGKRISTGGRADDVARGIVVPQMSYAVYLLFLGGLAALLAVPGNLKSLSRAFGSKEA